MKNRNEAKNMKPFKNILQTTENGFTLIEMVLTIALLGIVTITAIPQINTSEQAVSLDTAARSVEADIKYAQSLASITGEAHGLKVDPDNTTYTVYRKETDGDEFPVQSPQTHNVMDVNIDDKYQGISFVPQQDGIDIEFGPNGLPLADLTSSLDLVNKNGDTKTITISPTTGRIELINNP